MKISKLRLNPRIRIFAAAAVLAGLALACGNPVSVVQTLAPTAADPATAVPALPPPEEGHDTCVPKGFERQTAELVQVIDGDTIDVRIGGQVERVRYIGVDTPERDDPYYQEARFANQMFLGEGALTLVRDVSDRDRYDRLLRYVFSAEGAFVNYELMRGGYGQIITFPPDVSCAETFLAVQEQARSAGAGIWSLPHFQVQAGPGVVIESVFYNGVVELVESDEYAVITNHGEAPVDLGGWVLNAGGNQQDFRFPAYVLQPGESCRVYTNEVHPETCGFSFGFSEPVWSNRGDCGYLYDPDGALMSEYCY